MWDRFDCNFQLVVGKPPIALGLSKIIMPKYWQNML